MKFTYLQLLLTFSIIITSAQAAPPGLPDNPENWVCEGTDEPLSPQQIQAWCDANPDRGQPYRFNNNPATLANIEQKNKFDEEFRDFLRSRKYTELGWMADKEWRLTGPYVGEIGSGKEYGVHPLVRIYYSPEMTDWLCSGRSEKIKPGALIIKEMHNIEKDLVNVDAKGCMSVVADIEPGSWTVMLRAESESFDGWYWPNPSGSGTGNPPILDKSAVTSEDFFELSRFSAQSWYPTGDLFGKTLSSGGVHQANIVTPYTLFGAYCMNCHASAEKFLTYSSLDNIVTSGIQYLNFPEPPAYSDTDRNAISGSQHEEVQAAAANTGYQSPFPPPLAKPTLSFTEFFGKLGPLQFKDALALRFPAETYDHHLSSPSGADQFLTSDQCIGCHDATSSNDSIPNIDVLDKKTNQHINLSPYGEWRVSPMGLAGRDPIFFSQLQSETNNLPQITECIENTCLHCHGVMGQRQYAIDTQGQGLTDNSCDDIFAIAPPKGVPSGQLFSREMAAQWQGSGPQGAAKYGGLARDGISCTVCHHISDGSLGDESSFTGNFVTGPADELYGPYEKVVTKPMQHAIDITPKHAEQISDSDMCGTCHNILLPALNNNGTPHEITAPNGDKINHTYEQTTHLEWLNSDFAKTNSDTFKSCQNCHMPTHYKDIDLAGTKIANIESNEFAPTTHRLPDEEITLTPRDKYSRHSLHGLNIFLNQMFQQFPLILGLRQIDYMVKSDVRPALLTGAESMLEMARKETATVAVTELNILDNKQLKASVLVTNNTGHYLPSGVGFRRVFLEFIVYDKAGNEIWASGKTNELGLIIDFATGKALETESGDNNATLFQPHYQQLSKTDQVQIYQELIKDSDGILTTSFLRRVTHVKDNRLKGKGYDPEVYRSNPSPYIQELAVLYGEVKNDKYYSDPTLTGADRIDYLIDLEPAQLAQVGKVTVRLLNQSIPPFYLQQRFNDAHEGPANKDDIQRLFYLTSHLNTGAQGGPNPPSYIKDWKLQLATTCKALLEGACQ